MFILYRYTAKHLYRKRDNGFGDDVGKKKTSITVDAQLWKEWTMFVVDKTGSARKASDEIENAIREYMKKGK